MASDIQFHLMEETTRSPFTDHFTSTEGFARSEPYGLVLTPEFGRHFREFIDFPIRSDDVWVVTFPKCGTTWTQEMVWMIMNDCNKELAKEKLLTVRAPFLEASRLEKMDPLMLSEITKVMPTVEDVSNMPSPRVIKSHLIYALLPPKLLDTCKVVYVARNPKDVIVSYYYHHKLFKLQGFVGDLECFAKYFIEDKLWFSPYFPHILDAWAKRNNPNMLFLFYEDMKKNLRGEIEKVSKFLGKPLNEDKMSILLEHLKFDNLSKNESVNYDFGKKMGFVNQDGNFIRNGKTGDWKNHFSPELNRQIDEWIEKNLEGTDLKFDLELEQQD